MSNIVLDKELGVNPKLTICPRCGGDGDELMLIGNKKAIMQCPGCGVKCYGGKPNIQGKCPYCGNIDRYGWDKVGTISEHDRIPSTEPCSKCKAELKEHAEIVEAGGIYWRCADCHANGVMRKNEFTKAVREQHGVEFTKDDCPVCGEHRG